MGLKLVTAPATYPVTLEEAKAHLRVDDDDYDDLITIFVKAATSNAEQFLGLKLIDQTWDYYLDEFPTGDIVLPIGHLIEVVGVFYLDSAGVEQEFDVSDYEIDDANDLGRIILPTAGSWPTAKDTTNTVRIRVRAGYLNTDSPPSAGVPDDIKAAVLLNLGSLYEHRETVVIGQTATELPWGAEALLRPYRVRLGMA